MTAMQSSFASVSGITTIAGCIAGGLTRAMAA
jgi:hypothetical protein